MKYTITSDALGINPEDVTKKFILEYDDDDDELDTFKKTILGPDLALAFWELETKLRDKDKYALDKQPEEYTKAIQDVRDWLRECLDDQGVPLELIL